ncbi:MAG: hypothetical protein QXO55_07750 [Candidatus Korarchaeum sp.]
MRFLCVALLLLALPQIAHVGSSGNLLLTKEESFSIEGSVEVENLTFPLKFKADVVLSIWGPREVGSEDEYALAIEATREYSELNFGNRSIKLEEGKPAFSYKFDPIRIAYIFKLEFSFESELILDVVGAPNKSIRMRHDDGKVSLIELRGPADLKITPIYVLEASVAGSVFGKSVDIVRRELGRSTGEPIDLRVGLKGSVPTSRNESSTGSNRSAQQIGGTEQSFAYLIGILLASVILIYLLRRQL